MKHSRLILLLACLLLCGAPPAHSQGFLNKLAKKVEKVNKGVSKVLDAVKEKPQPKTPQSPQPAAQSQGQPQPAAPSAGVQKPPSPGKPLTAKEIVNLTATRPYVDERTIFIVLPANDFSGALEASDVVEGVFCVQGNMGLKVFYDVETGRRLAAVRGAGMGHDYHSPYTDYVQQNDQTLSGGFLTMQLSKALPSGEKYVTVSSEGKVYALPKTYNDVTRMLDGMALAHVNYNRDIVAINPYGADINPALNGQLKYDLVMRYLRENRRAVYFGEKWGFVDAKGNVVIPGRYDEVSDFSNGVAWVKSDNKMGLIDLSGKEVLAPSIGARPGATRVFQRDVMSEFSPEGICRYMPEEWTTVYYDRSGRELKHYKRAQGTPFVNGLAWVSYINGLEKGEDGRIEVIDRDFKVVATLDGSYGDYFTSSVQPTFRPGLDVAGNGDHQFVNQYGRTVIKCDTYDHNTCRNFSADGYAWMRYSRPEWWGAYMRPDGSLAVVLVTDKTIIPVIWEKHPPLKPRPPQPKPPIEDPPVKEDPPQQPPGEKLTFQVGVKVVPAEAATVKGAGRYGYNAEAAVSGSLAEGWMLGSVEASPRLKATDRPFVYRVEGSGTITVYCIRKPDVKPAADLALEGRIPFIQNTTVPLYLETSAAGRYASEYGAETSGVLAVMIDPNKTYSSESETGTKVTFSARLFCPPMKVEGVSEENGRKYLVASGVTAMAGSMNNTGTGSLNAVGLGAWFNLLMSMSGINNVVFTPRTYRIEMNDFDPATREFTFGALEVWSGKYGWLPGGDRRVQETRNGFLMSASENGFGADDFKGVRMKPVDKRNDLIWSPPADFFTYPPLDFGVKVYGTPTEFHKTMKTHTATFGPK